MKLRDSFMFIIKTYPGKVLKKEENTTCFSLIFNFKVQFEKGSGAGLLGASRTYLVWEGWCGDWY